MAKLLRNQLDGLSPVLAAAKVPAHETPATSDADDNPHRESTATLAALLTAGEQSSWTVDALCTNKTHLFFAPPGERMTRRNKREALAKSYCDQCTVSQQCRTWARENRESGFWGGENEEQRAAAGFAPRSPNRRAVALAARAARDAT